MVDILLQIAAVPHISDPSDFTAVYEQLVPQWISAVYPYAGELFSALAFLDLAVFGWTLIRRHGNNIQGAILSTTNRLVLIGAFLALLMKGSEWMGYIVQMFVQVGKAGGGVTSIQPSVVLQQGVQIVFAILGQSALSGALLTPIVGIPMVIAALFIGISFLFVAGEFVVTKIQTFLVLGMGFFFLAFGGSSWTRTYVERYFSYAFSAGIRLMALYFLVGAGQTVTNLWLLQAKQSAWSLDGVKQAWLIMFGAAIYAMICWRCPAIAAQLLGGGPNLSHSDIFQAVGTAISAGVGVSQGASALGSATTGAVMATSSALGGGGGSAGSGSTPASKPPSGGSNGSKGPSAAQAASAAASAMHGMGSGGNRHAPVPNFKGFGGSDE